MIPPPDEVPGLAGAVDDSFIHGYHDNQELRFIIPNTPSTCELLARFGRLTGFGVGFQGPDAPTHHVTFAVHLFADGGGRAGVVGGVLRGFSAAGRPA